MSQCMYSYYTPMARVLYANICTDCCLSVVYLSSDDIKRCIWSEMYLDRQYRTWICGMHCYTIHILRPRVGVITLLYLSLYREAIRGTWVNRTIVRYCYRYHIYVVAEWLHAQSRAIGRVTLDLWALYTLKSSETDASWWCMSVNLSLSYVQHTHMSHA